MRERRTDRSRHTEIERGRVGEREGESEREARDIVKGRVLY